MAVTFDDVQKLKEKLAQDLEVVRQFEELLQRHGINGHGNGNGNGNGHKRETPPPTSSPVLPGMQEPVKSPVLKGINTGLADKLVAMVVASANGLSLSEVTDALIATGYAYSTRDNLKSAVGQSLKRQIELGRLKRFNGKYVKP